MSSSKNVSDFRRNRKRNLVIVCGGKCNLCGYDKSIAALEFHHIHSENKSYGIAVSGTCHDLERDLIEVKKCILVCANCHREIHDGVYSPEELEMKQIFSETYANKLREDKIKLFEKTVHKCSICGKEICRTSKGMCAECRAKTRRKVERPTRKELKDLIRNQPFTKIAEMFGVSDKTISKWCQVENLPSRKKDIKKYSDKEWDTI